MKKTFLLSIYLVFFFIGCMQTSNLNNHDTSRISIFSNGQFVLGSFSKSHDLKMLVNDLELAHVSKKQTLFLKIDSDVPFSLVLATLDDLKKAGFSIIQFDTGIKMQIK